MISNLNSTKTEMFRDFFPHVLTLVAEISDIELVEIVYTRKKI